LGSPAIAPVLYVGIPALRALLRMPQEGDHPHTPEAHDKVFPELPPLATLVDELAEMRHGLVMVMGKGGVGKTTIAAAIATVRRAISACKRSTIRPSIDTTPLPLFSGRSKAAIILRACSTSACEGEKALLHGSIWLG